MICRVSKGPHAGRLICLMRTGRELRESISDDAGTTWSAPTRGSSPASTFIRPSCGKRCSAAPKILRASRSMKTTRRNCAGSSRSRPHRTTQRHVSGSVRSASPAKVMLATPGAPLEWQLPRIQPRPRRNLDHSRANDIRRSYDPLHGNRGNAAHNDLYVTYDLGGWSKGMRRDIIGRSVKVSVDAD